MESLLDFALDKRYKRVVKLGAKVAEFDTLIKWDRFYYTRICPSYSKSSSIIY